MLTYQGPTVIISGTIIYGDYKSEADSVVSLRARSKKDTNRADIARSIIPGPGAYSLKVPKDFGEVYVDAVVVKRGRGRRRAFPLRPDSPRGDYPHNPVKVGSSDIQNVDIRIQK